MAVLHRPAAPGAACGSATWTAQGVASQRVVDPISVGGGVLEAFDSAATELRRFALHRITSVALTED